jgi:O-antigen/teichoic acid export membrane protein
MSLKKQFVSGVLSGGAGFILKTLAMLLLTPLVVGDLGATGYGVYLVLLSLAEMAMLLATGLTAGYVQQLSDSLGKQHTASPTPTALSAAEQHHQLQATAKWLFGGLAVGVFAVGVLSLPMVLPVLIKPPLPMPINVLHLAALWVLGGASLGIIQQYVMSILRAHAQQVSINVLECAQGLIEPVLAIVALKAGWGLPGVFACRAGLIIIMIVMASLQAHKIETSLLTAWQDPRVYLSRCKKMLSISVYAMLSRIGVFIAHRMDEIIIAMMLTLTDVTGFGLLMRLMSQVAALSLKLLDGLSPLFARFTATVDTAISGSGLMPNAVDNRSQQLMLRSLAVVHYLTLLLLTLLMVGLPEFINYLGHGQVGVNWWVAGIAAVTIWSGSVQIPASNYVFSSGRYRFQTASTLVTAGLNLVLSILFIKWIGLPGVILGTLVPQGIQHQFVTIPMACRKLGLPWRAVGKLYVQAIPAWGVAVILGGVLRLTMAYSPQPFIPLWLLLVVLPLIMLTSVWVWSLTCLTPEEKHLLKQMIGNRLPLLKKRITHEELA